MIRRLLSTYTELSEEQAKALRTGPGHAVRVLPPRNSSVPATVENFLRGILEIQTRLFKLENVSPVTGLEIRRSQPERLQLQYVAPTKRLERKIRTHLSEEVPEIRFETGSHGIPVTSEETVGGGFLTTGRKDRSPLRTKFDFPPTNGIVASLHRHAMRDTKILIQILFKPIVGRSLKQYWLKRQAYKNIGFLRKEKEQLWGSRSPTPRERKQADLIEKKMGTRRYRTSIRLVVIGAGEYTSSRVKELAGGFNIFENPESGQYLSIETVKGLRRKPFLDFLKPVSRREIGNSLRFQASTEELAGLVAVPDRDQQNLEKSL